MLCLTDTSLYVYIRRPDVHSNVHKIKIYTDDTLILKAPNFGKNTALFVSTQALPASASNKSSMKLNLIMGRNVIHVRVVIGNSLGSSN